LLELFNRTIAQGPILDGHLAEALAKTLDKSESKAKDPARLQLLGHP
jgi:hypothetical protein